MPLNNQTKPENWTIYMQIVPNINYKEFFYDVSWLEIEFS